MQRSKVMNFRASPQLADELAAAAERDGVGVSSVIRQAVEDHLARAAKASPSATSDPIFHKMASAARGSLETQRELARLAVEMAFQTDAEGKLIRDPEMCLTEGLVFARLAAAQGDISDQGLVISMIGLLSGVVGEANSQEQLAEALARLSLVADLNGGWEDSSTANMVADAVVEMVGETSAATAAMAKGYTARIRDRVFEK